MTNGDDAGGLTAGVLAGFHPAVRTWFERTFEAPTDAQAAGWPAIRSGQDTLLAAPTGSGKTLAAFMVGVNDLVERAAVLPPGEVLPDETSIVYVSPLKALGNDIERNLEEPLAGIQAIAEELGTPLPPITVGLRTGDTSQSERQAMVRRPRHIVITTPESLYLLATAERSRKILETVRTVIVDEIHAVARDRRGSHLAITLARLDHVITTAGHPRPARIGLSATQRPIEDIARFLVGVDRDGGDRPCTIVDLGHQRDLELHIELPPSDLEAVAPKEQMGEIYDRMAELVRQHHTTLIFVNTRALSERVAHQLGERLGEDWVASHHGSLSRERRERVERRLKSGELRALVATASLELGIDIGSIDLVCQLGSARSIATFLQRIGRSGHALGLRPEGRLFPLTRDELVECAALVRATREGRLDRIKVPVGPIDVVAQHVVAEAACQDWPLDDLFDLVRQATPFRDLTREAFDEVVEMEAVGIGDGAGRSKPLVHLDRVNGVVRARRASRISALTNGGTIPEMGDYRVIAEPEGTVVGNVNEDFAIESMAGDIFLLGSTSWRIQRVEQSTVRVSDAHGAPPTIPFWLGEAPGRTVELSEEVGRLRRDVVGGLDDREGTHAWLRRECALPELGAQQIYDYLRAQQEGMGIVASDTDVVFERFFDESGGMQLVVHAPFGQRINRAWGLALRKRFCVAFDFELQAAANDDAILLSSGPQHSWPLEEAFDWVSPRNVYESVEQSVFYVPLFPTRWRWNTTRALAVQRQRGGKRVPPFIQRMRADDLMAAVFPEQVGCQENVTGPMTLPEHPLMQQTMRDCLYEAMDLEGLTGLLERVEAGEVRFHARDTIEASPMAHEIVSGKPYTFLDDAPLEERRTRAVTLRRGLPESAQDLGALDMDAIERVADEAWPEPRDADEAHDALLGLVAIDASVVEEWEEWLLDLVAQRRAVALTVGDRRIWVTSEQLKVAAELFGEEVIPFLDLPAGVMREIEHREAARGLLLRGHAEVTPAVTAEELAERCGLPAKDVERGLTMLEASGFVLRGQFRTPSTDSDEFCDRRLLARIHRYTLDRLRREIDPVAKQDYMRFLLRWHGLDGDESAGRLEGRGGLRQALTKLQGFEAPAGAWESELLAARLPDYQSSWLDELCLAGEATWARLTPRRPRVNEAGVATATTTAATRATPVTLALRQDLGTLLSATRGIGRGWGVEAGAAPSTGAAAEVLATLQSRGALFFDELVTSTRRLATDVEQGLRELIGGGWVTSDGFQGLREIAGGRKGGAGGRRERWRRARRASAYAHGLFLGGGPPGRWSALVTPEATPGTDDVDEDDLAEAVAMILLERYGVVFRDLMRGESLTMPWRFILRALRRFEARGTIRGGRFVAGVVGEQYALPEAVELLRRVRREPRNGQRTSISAVDPLNLTGHVLPGERVPAQRGRTIDLVDGLPVEVSRTRPRERPTRSIALEAPPAGDD